MSTVVCPPSLSVEPDSTQCSAPCDQPLAGSAPAKSCSSNQVCHSEENSGQGCCASTSGGSMTLQNSHIRPWLIVPTTSSITPNRSSPCNCCWNWLGSQTSPPNSGIGSSPHLGCGHGTVLVATRHFEPSPCVWV